MITFVPKPILCVAIIGAGASLFGLVAADETFPANEAIRSAVVKSLPLLEKGARGSTKHRKQCFNCHNQGLPIMAFVTAQSRGIDIDQKLLQQQVQFTADFLTRNKDRYREGDGQGGQVDTAGYALWALDNGGWKPDETTAAVAEYFLLRQSDQPHWRPDGIRPPAEQSFFTSTYVALRGMKVFGVPEQQARIAARIDQVREWLLKTPAQDTEDRVFRLRALPLVAASEEDIRQATNDLLSTQGDDGGWGQTADRSSDAYATGTALVALHEVGNLSAEDPVYRKGVKYLISHQEEDGSWHVVSHCTPFQTYYESGYPHGKDQFISIAAASWSTTALALSLPKSPVLSP